MIEVKNCEQEISSALIQIQGELQLVKCLATLYSLQKQQNNYILEALKYTTDEQKSAMVNLFNLNSEILITVQRTLKGRMNTVLRSIKETAEDVQELL
jgi:hypothetical protein